MKLNNCHTIKYTYEYISTYLNNYIKIIKRDFNDLVVSWLARVTVSNITVFELCLYTSKCAVYLDNHGAIITVFHCHSSFNLHVAISSHFSILWKIGDKDSFFFFGSVLISVVCKKITFWRFVYIFLKRWNLLIICEEICLKYDLKY